MPVSRKGVPLDSAWVVPFSPALLALFDCHINVEAVTSVAAVKYIYKYIYKGPDRAMVALQDAAARAARYGLPLLLPARPSVASGRGAPPHSMALLTFPACAEVREFIDARSVSATEAFWRLAAFPLGAVVPAVHRLPVHLPDQHQVHFGDDDDLDLDVLDNGRATMLTAFFALNASPDAPLHADGRPFLYRGAFLPRPCPSHLRAVPPGADALCACARRSWQAHGVGPCWQVLAPAAPWCGPCRSLGMGGACLR